MHLSNDIGEIVEGHLFAVQSCYTHSLTDGAVGSHFLKDLKKQTGLLQARVTPQSLGL